MSADVVNSSAAQNPVEEWRGVPGFTRYQVSNLGRIRSLRSRGEWKIMSLYQEKTGYITVSFCRNGKIQSKKFVHRLVLEVFVGLCPEGMEARHVNSNDRTDNRLSNLCWGTKLENAADRKKHGTELKGELANSAKLTEQAVLDIKRRLSRGERPCRLAAELGLCKSTVCRIKTGQTWQHVVARTG